MTWEHLVNCAPDNEELKCILCQISKQCLSHILPLFSVSPGSRGGSTFASAVQGLVLVHVPGPGPHAVWCGSGRGLPVQVFVCGVKYREEDMMILEEEDVEVDMPSRFKMIQENIRVLEDQEVALINVPVPEFDDSDPADIVHDFQRRLTAYLDLFLNKCYVIPLNTSIVMPPKDFLELLVNIKAGTYLPQSYLVHEEMVVTERLEDVEQLGYFINNLCQGKDTYKLERRDRILGMQKREALNCHKIRHFENKFVVETLICEP
uniref:Integral membrane protein 2 n=1 Tax=Oncorhynchus tshawytscha TaxID=74940 RepID=A0AAZ3RY16_ONCTS